ncbi:hypothetical protein LTR84_001841 [Exophiala bonariae]|uniref:FAM192A/Fyv6 N-terminal domain-containing protein n=1 Tax=Exophiala bonariae TaxID=1690606 RepID=A0AAV9NBU4_9EURO|nr:hypothetical protein LTR84_001841 [Exophiala bonariae]
MSRFVSAGTDADSRPQLTDDAWAQARQEVEAKQQIKSANQNRESGKSLYEVLEQNKAAKQEAFEEAARLKNQFRALDDDEVDFLDSVLESTRARENAVKEETAEQLDAFRKQRLQAEQSLIDADAQHNENSGNAASSDAWVIKKKKRRRDQDRTTSAESTTVTTKLRKLSSTAADDKGDPVDSDTSPITKTPVPVEPVPQKTGTTDTQILSPGITSTLQQQRQTAVPVAASAGLGLGGYSSDEDD